MSDDASPQAGSPTAAPAAAPVEGANGVTFTAEWAAKAVDTVDLVVNTVGDKAVRPVLVAARGVVFGLIIATMAVVVVVLASISLIRLLDVYVFGHRVWASYALLGAVITTSGLMVWSQRAPRPAGKGS